MQEFSSDSDEDYPQRVEAQPRGGSEHWFTARFELITHNIQNAPYDHRHYRYRASFLQRMGLSDLAIADLYKALLLLDDFLDESGEYHDEVCQAEDAYNQDWSRERKTEIMSKRAHLLCRELVDIMLTHNCLASAYDFCVRSLRYGFLGPDETLDVLREKAEILEKGRRILDASSGSKEQLLKESEFDPSRLPDEMQALRMVYRWNGHEPERYSNADLSTLNRQLAKVAPKLDVRLTDLPLFNPFESPYTGVKTTTNQQFGLFAKEDISPGEEILSENSILTANRYLYGELCDACSGPLPPVGETSFSCPECDEAAFCSKECLDAAMASYHPAVCDTDANTVAKDAKPSEAADSLYFLLVARALAMSEHQGVHPLELPETKFLWGDFGPRAKLPFSFKWNVQYPLHVLEKMNVNIFTSVDRYDHWVFNTLYAKFRGVASGRVGVRDGIPEVCAVHPLWCLANHSCAPNVRWEWGGNIRFWARTEDDLVRWGANGSRMVAHGIQQDQEIFSHYGDVGLSVTQRREWMRGALGGDCKCDRCLWEEKQPKKQQEQTAQSAAVAQ